MRSWTAPAPPRLPGYGPPLRLHDTSTGEVRPVAPGAAARMYVCGITPYDAAHLGHASTYVAFDTVNRVWRDAGHRVRYIQNVTDIDDPLFERARATGEDWAAIAAREVEAFRSDMSALRVLPPEDLVGAVESVQVIADLVGRLADAGAAYELDGDVYFPVASAPRFGEVAHLDTERMLTLSRERGGDPDRPGKKDPLDSLLWRAQRPGEPAWPSRFGPGRPGWHVECAAIALDRLGPGIDVQAGGSDLAFPHHEMSAAQACAASGTWPFARLFVHSGMVALSGTKMSKSLGNLVFVSGLRAAGADPAAVRLALLAHHYREDWEWTDGQLADATARLSRWRAAAALPAGPPAGELLAQVRRLLADDLRTPDALAAVDRWAGSGEHDRGGRDPRAPGQVADLVDALLGVPLR